MTKWRRCIAVATVAGVVFGASTGAGAITMHRAARQYLRDAAAYNAAVDSVNVRMASWTTATTPEQAQRDVQPAIRAGFVFQHRLVTQAWPDRARRAVMTLYMALARFDGLLSSIRTVSVFDGGVIIAALNSAGVVAASDANVVRHDLGLPLVAS